MGSILSPAPLDLVDLLFYFEGFEIIEFGFVRLELRMELVLACFFLDNVNSSALLLGLCFHQRLCIPSRFFQKAQLGPPCHRLQGSCRYDRTRQLK
jgi:hypothetical protein